MRRTRNPVYGYTVPWVRIPPFPPIQDLLTCSAGLGGAQSPAPRGAFCYAPLRRGHPARATCGHHCGVARRGRPRTSAPAAGHVAEETSHPRVADGRGRHGARGLSVHPARAQVPRGDVVAAASAHGADVPALSLSALLSPTQVLDPLAELRARLPGTVALWVGARRPWRAHQQASMYSRNLARWRGVRENGSSGQRERRSAPRRCQQESRRRRLGWAPPRGGPFGEFAQRETLIMRHIVEQL